MLVITNAQVLEWIDWAFDLTKPRGGPIRVRRTDTTEDPSIDIEDARDRAPTQMPDGLEDQSTPLTASMSGQITMMMVDRRPPPPPVHTPLGTPPSYSRQEVVAPPVRELPPMPRLAPPADLAPPPRRGLVLPVVLVLLVAVIAAAAVYFVLPLV